MSLLCVQAYYLKSVARLLSEFFGLPGHDSAHGCAPTAAHRLQRYGGAALAGTTAGLPTEGGQGRTQGLSSHLPRNTLSRVPRQLVANGTLRRGVCPARANRKRLRDKFKLRWRLGGCVSRSGAGGPERTERLPSGRGVLNGSGDGGRGSRDGLRPCAAAYRQVRFGVPGLRGGCRGARGLGVPHGCSRDPLAFSWTPGGAATALRRGGGGDVTAGSIPVGNGRAGTNGDDGEERGRREEETRVIGAES